MFQFPYTEKFFSDNRTTFPPVMTFTQEFILKKKVILSSLIFSVTLIYPQSTEIYSIKATKVDRGVTEISQRTLDTLSLNGLRPIYNQFLNVTDFDNDGLEDIILNIASDPTINNYSALFKQQNNNGKVKFIEDPNYLMNIEGELSGSFYENVGDVNGDGLLDVVMSTENYHGPDDQQPAFMINNTESLDKIFINTGSGFKRFGIDTTTTLFHWNGNGKPEWWNTNGSKVIDWDGDGKLEILSSTQNFERIAQLRQGVDRLFTSFKVDVNNNITRDFVFDWNYDQERIDTRIQFLKKVDDHFYLAIFKNRTWDTVNSTFVDNSLNDGQKIIKHSDMEVVIVDSKKSFGQQGSIRKVMKRTFNGGDYIYQKGFHVVDIDNDNKNEFIQQYWYESDLKQVPFIRVYDDDGTDVTDTWLGDKYIETSNNGGGNGMSVVDLNNDGLPDITPKDGWKYTRNSHTPSKVEGTYGTFGIFMNDGNQFNQYNVDFTDFGNLDYGGGAAYFRYPVDFDNDGYYEILMIMHGYNTVWVDIVTLDYKNNIEQIENFSIKEDSTVVLKLLGEDLKGDSVSYSVKSSETNVSATLSNDTLTLTPFPDWYGDTEIVAYASSNSWKDSTTFTLTVTKVNDLPTTFSWQNNSFKKDSINVDNSNLETEYTLWWTSSKDVDGDTLQYLIKGVDYTEGLIDVVLDTTYTFKYQDLIDNWPPVFSPLPGMVFKFDIWVHDGIDSVQITGDPFELFVSRYDYLSTESEGIPIEYSLHQNYPNPFNPITNIKFDLPEAGDITIVVYNIRGQRIRTFNYQNTSAGYHSVTWDATNDYSEQVGAGVYLYQLQTKDFVKTRKMVLLK